MEMSLSLITIPAAGWVLAAVLLFALASKTRWRTSTKPTSIPTQRPEGKPSRSYYGVKEGMTTETLKKFGY